MVRSGEGEAWREGRRGEGADERDGVQDFAPEGLLVVREVSELPALRGVAGRRGRGEARRERKKKKEARTCRAYPFRNISSSSSFPREATRSVAFEGTEEGMRSSRCSATSE